MRILGEHPPRAGKRAVAAWMALVACLLLLAPGCQRLLARRPAESDPASQSAPSLVREEVEAALQQFDEYHAAKVTAASASIANSGVSSQARSAALRWRAETIPRVREFTYSPEPLAGLLGTWEHCIQVRAYLESGAGAGLFESVQPQALEAAREIEAEIERVVREVAPESYVDTVEPIVAQRAAQRPLTGVFGPPAPPAQGAGAAAGAAALDVATRVATIPMIPLRTLTSVNDTTSSIGDFSRTASRMADIVQDLPRDLRLQVQLLLADLDSTGQLTGFSEALNNMALALREGSAAARELPPQVVAAAAEMDARVQSSTAALNAVLDNAEEAMARLDSSIKLAAASLAEATALAPTAHGLMGDMRDTSEELQALAADIASLREASRPDPGAEPGPGVEEYTAMLRQTQASAAEIRALLGEVQALQAPQGALDAVGAQGRALVDHAFARLLVLVLVALAGSAGVVVLATWRRR